MLIIHRTLIDKNQMREFLYERETLKKKVCLHFFPPLDKIISKPLFRTFESLTIQVLFFEPSFLYHLSNIIYFTNDFFTINKIIKQYYI